MTPKILLAAPTSDKKAYCQYEWIEWIEQLTYDNIEFLIIDNSDTNKNFERLQEYEWLDCCRCLPKKNENIRDRVLRSMQMIWFQFCKGDYKHCTHLAILESDQFPPLNYLEYLLCQEYQICGLPYFHFEGNDTMLLNCVFHKNRKGENIASYQHPLESFLFFGESDDDSEFVRTWQSGIGCLLIERPVVEKIHPRVGPEAAQGFPDSFLHIDWGKANIPVMLSRRYFTIHKNTYDLGGKAKF